MLNDPPWVSWKRKDDNPEEDTLPFSDTEGIDTCGKVNNTKGMLTNRSNHKYVQQEISGQTNLSNNTYLEAWSVYPWG